MSEERDSLEESMIDGQLVSAMIHSDGWKQVVKPALVARRDSLLKEFENALELTDFIRLQQSVNAINGLFDFIEAKLIEGKASFENLNNN